MGTVQKLLCLLDEYGRHGEELIKKSIIDLANQVLVSSRGYSCVEAISFLRTKSYTVTTQQLLGEPDPKVRGVIECDLFNIQYGAVMTPCQKQLVSLLDELDGLLLDQPIAKGQQTDLNLDSVKWSDSFALARTKVIQLAKSIFFEGNIRKVRFGDLIIFCKEAGLILRESGDTKNASYFVISSDSYTLRVDRPWA